MELIDGEHRGDDVHVVAHGTVKERADRAIDHARAEDRRLRGTAFSLDVAAGDLSGSVVAFLKVHQQREEIQSRAGLVGHADGGQHGGLAVRGDDGRARLLGDLACLEDQVSPAYVQCVRLFHCKDSSFYFLRSRCAIALEYHKIVKNERQNSRYIVFFSRAAQNA